jgi:hypothetical protein
MRHKRQACSSAQIDTDALQPVLAINTAATFDWEIKDVLISMVKRDQQEPSRLGDALASRWQCASTAPEITTSIGHRRMSARHSATAPAPLTRPLTPTHQGDLR